MLSTGKVVHETSDALGRGPSEGILREKELPVATLYGRRSRHQYPFDDRLWSIKHSRGPNGNAPTGSLPLTWGYHRRFAQARFSPTGAFNWPIAPLANTLMTL